MCAAGGGQHVAVADAEARHPIDFHHHAGHTDSPLQRHPAARITDRAVACVDDIDPARPHALWVSYWMPHEPWAPPLEYRDRYRPEDMPAVRGIVRGAAANGYRVSSLILGVVRAPQFQMRVKSPQEQS
jgi:hypothetical protein